MSDILKYNKLCLEIIGRQSTGPKTTAQWFLIISERQLYTGRMKMSNKNRTKQSQFIYINI